MRCRLAFFLLVVGCATKGSTTEPKDPCEKAAQGPGFFDGVLGTSAHAENKAECAEIQRAEQDAAYAARFQAEQEQAKFVAEHAAKAAEEEAERRAAEEAAELEEQERMIAAYEERERRKAYALALESPCEDWDEIRAAYETLAIYKSNPERDAAIKRLEGCRKDQLAKMRERAKPVVADARKEFAILLEDAFDEANPYSAGRFVAKHQGSELRVRMKGNFEGRARHSQSQVDGWCESTSVFSKIVLSNSHGTFSCVPESWPGSTKKYIRQLLDEIGVTTPFRTEPGNIDAPALEHEQSGTETE